MEFEKITVVKGEEIINAGGKNAEIVNNFFSNAVKNLKIPEHQEGEPHTNNISHPIFKAIMKIINHPSVTVIKNLNNGSRDNFCRVCVEDGVKEIKKLSTRNATRSTDLPVKILTL